MIIQKLRKLLTCNKGQSTTEYIIIIALVAIAAIGIYTAFGDKIRGKTKATIETLDTGIDTKIKEEDKKVGGE